MPGDNPGLESKMEGDLERNPTKEEIFSFLGVDLAQVIGEQKEELDEEGLYFLQFRIEGKENGEVIEYEFMRRGKFAGWHESVASPDGLHSGTSIHETYFDQEGNMLPPPQHIAEYNHERGEWIKA